MSLLWPFNQRWCAQTSLYILNCLCMTVKSSSFTYFSLCLGNTRLCTQTQCGRLSCVFITDKRQHPVHVKFKNVNFSSSYVERISFTVSLLVWLLFAIFLHLSLALYHTKDLLGVLHCMTYTAAVQWISLVAVEEFSRGLTLLSVFFRIDWGQQRSPAKVKVKTDWKYCWGLSLPGYSVDISEYLLLYTSTMLYVRGRQWVSDWALHAQ